MAIATDTQIVKGLDQSAFEDALGGDKTRSKAEASRKRRHTVSVWALLADEATAATATNQPFWRVPAAGPIQLISARYIPTSALTAADATKATINLQVNDDAGGTLTTIATMNTATAGGGGTGNWTALQSQGFAVSATAPTAAAGQMLHFVTAKTSTGTVVPQGILEIEFEDI